MRVSAQLVGVLGVVLAEEVFAVVVAVGGADDGVDVGAAWEVAGKGGAALVVEFYEDDGAVDAVVEGAVVAGEGALPGEVGLA